MEKVKGFPLFYQRFHIDGSASMWGFAVWHKRVNKIMAFDLGSEEFHVVPQWEDYSVSCIATIIFTWFVCDGGVWGQVHFWDCCVVLGRMCLRIWGLWFVKWVVVVVKFCFCRMIGNSFGMIWRKMKWRRFMVCSNSWGQKFVMEAFFTSILIEDVRMMMN